ncbi:MAG: type IVB secretion system protein IcmH/DotU [bacterium]|nr:type IVB secretion system protein IcmH/DotU [bacterium]
MHSIEVTRGTRLSELAADTLAFAVQLRGAAEPAAEQLRAEVRKLFTEFDAAAQAAGKELAVVETVRYALAAFLDEIVLSSNWGLRQEWSGRPLQMEYFNDFTAGEEFYRKLEALRGGDGQRREALEVYALVLGLGFRGKFAGMSGLEEARRLRARLHEELASGVGQQPLSPNWEVEEQSAQMVKRVPAWVFAAASGGVVLLLLVVLRLWLNGTESGFVETLVEGR